MEWNDFNWASPQIPKNPTFGYVRAGNMPHETLNFDFNKPVDTNEEVFGFLQSRGKPRLANSKDDLNVIFFHSRKNIVGVYGYARYLEKKIEYEHPKFENKKHELNIVGKRDFSLGFIEEAYLKVEPRHLNDKEIRQSTIIYIKVVNAKKILSDVVNKYHRIIASKTDNKLEKQHLAKLKRLILALSDASSFGNSERSNFSKLLSNKKQIILYGPPGTGKTFHAQRNAVTFLNKNQSMTRG